MCIYLYIQMYTSRCALVQNVTCLAPSSTGIEGCQKFLYAFVHISIVCVHAHFSAHFNCMRSCTFQCTFLLYALMHISIVCVRAHFSAHFYCMRSCTFQLYAFMHISVHISISTFQVFALYIACSFTIL